MILALAMAASTIAVSCDGTLIVAAGAPMPRVWRRLEAEWEQVHGPPAAPPSPEAAGVQRASCAKAPISNMPMVPAGMKRVGGSSRDRSLLWSHQVDARGAWHFVARSWTGARYDAVIDATGPAQ